MGGITSESMIGVHGLTLVVSSRPVPDKDRIASSWSRAGGVVLHLEKSWEPPPLQSPGVRLYGNQVFCTELSTRLNLSLVAPPDDFIFRIDPRFVKRSVHLSTLRELAELDRPVFLKPLQQKLFPAGIYSSFDDLSFQCCSIPDSTLVIKAEVVEFASEYRLFVLNRQIVAMGCYLGMHKSHGLIRFFRKLIGTCVVPDAFVLDLGYIPHRGWAVVEANPAWGSALRGCHAAGATTCIAFATRAHNGE
jgi:hypothetical protein